MDMLMRFKRATKMLFHDKTVDKLNIAMNISNKIAMIANCSAASFLKNFMRVAILLEPLIMHTAKAKTIKRPIA